VFGFGADRGEREARRASVVTVDIHGVFQAAGAVHLGDEERGVGDAPLPVDAGFFFAGAEGFPDGDCGVGAALAKAVAAPLAPARRDSQTWPSVPARMAKSLPACSRISATREGGVPDSRTPTMLG